MTTELERAKAALKNTSRLAINCNRRVSRLRARLFKSDSRPCTKCGKGGSRLVRDMEVQERLTDESRLLDKLWQNSYRLRSYIRSLETVNRGFPKLNKET